MSLNYSGPIMATGPSDLTPNSFGAESPQESGLPAPQAQKSPYGFPPGLGKYAVPHFVSFSNLINYFTRVYRYSFDEAVKNCQEMANAMRREPVLMQALRERQMPVTQLSWHLEPDNPRDERQAEAAEVLTEVIRRTPRLQQLLRMLQEAIFFGRYGVQVVYSWEWNGTRRELRVRDFVPVNGDKLVFRYSGQVGILVHSTWTGDTAITDRGRAHFFTPEEREQLFVHTFEPEDADFFEGDMAGSINGLGIRGRLYWLFWLRQNVMSWMMDYLERVGAGGFTVYYYEHGNSESLEEVKDAAESQVKQNSILFPRYRDNTTGGPGIERIEPSLAGAQLIRDLVMSYFDEVIRRYILGQDVVGDSDTIVGEGPADLHAGNFARIIKYDANDLADTLTRDWVAVVNKYMFPANPCPRWVFDVDKPNADEYMEGVKTFYEMGGEVDEDSVREVLGIPRPEPGHRVLSQATMALQQAQQQAQAAQMMAMAVPQPMAPQGAAPPEEGGPPAEVGAVYGS